VNGFDVIFALTAGCAALALYRMRAATFIYAANQAAITRSLSLIVDYGRPPSLKYVPRWVFQPSNTDIALVVFAISTLLLIAFLLAPSRTPPATPAEYPRVPTWMVGFVVLYVVVFAFSMRSVAEVQYSSKDQQLFWLPAGGVQAFVGALLMYALYVRIVDGKTTPLKAFLLYFAAFVVTDYAKGTTGMASGLVFSAAILFFSASGRSKRPRLWVVGILVVIVSLASVIRNARVSFHDEGLGAISTAVTRIVDQEASARQNAAGLETSVSGHEFAALTLECITLYESGNDRQWASTYRTLLYTLQPQFVMELGGWKRAKDAGDEIREYFTTNGGMAIYGESYWNGGYLGVFVILGAIIAACYWIDCSFRHGFLYLILFCNYAPCMVQGVGYGVSHEVRGFMNGILMAGAYYLWVSTGLVWRRLFGRAPAPVRVGLSRAGAR
jgi:hypothetical protein